MAEDSGCMENLTQEHRHNGKDDHMVQLTNHNHQSEQSEKVREKDIIRKLRNDQDEMPKGEHSEEKVMKVAKRPEETERKGDESKETKDIRVGKRRKTDDLDVDGDTSNNNDCHDTQTLQLKDSATPVEKMTQSGSETNPNNRPSGEHHALDQTDGQTNGLEDTLAENDFTDGQNGRTATYTTEPSGLQHGAFPDGSCAKDRDSTDGRPGTQIPEPPGLQQGAFPNGSCVPRWRTVGLEAVGELRGLLVDTQPVVRWQQAVKRLLHIYLLPQEAYRALDFIAHLINAAYQATQHPEKCLGYPSLKIDMDRKPAVFDLDQWKTLLIALHFDLTEPESNRHADLIEINVTDNVTLQALSGFKSILQSLAKMRWDLLRMLLALTEDEAMHLAAALQVTVVTTYNNQIMKNLHARYPDQLADLGFTLCKVKGQTSGRRETEVRWQQPQSQTVLDDLLIALIGLFHDGSGLEVFV